MSSEEGRAPDDATALVRECWSSGDHEEAHRLMVRSTHASLSRYLRHLVADEEAARELFQETYLRAFRALGAFRGDSTITTWVLTIGRNLAMNHLRRTRARGLREVSLEADDERAPVIPAAAVAVDEVATRSVLRELEALPVSQREAVLLFYGQDLTIEEVARLTGRPVNTVKSDLLRARTRLRSRLEPRVCKDGR